MDLFTYGGIATGVVVATLQCAAGDISPSAALAIVFISSFFFLPMRRLGSLFHTGMNANAVCERIFALLDAEDQFATDEQIDLGDPGITCSNLSFSYDGKVKALDGGWKSYAHNRCRRFNKSGVCKIYSGGIFH